MALVYVIDDDSVTAEAIAAALAREDHEIRTFNDPKRAVEAARETAPAVAITDFSMPGMNGLELVLELREISPDSTFLVVSGQATVEDAVSLMKHGVVDVMVKPPRARALRKALGLALTQHELAAENRRLRQALRGRRDLSGVIGTSPAFESVLRQVEKVAPSGATVLLTGETGTGKEVIAEALHQLSERAERPLVKVHCSAIPETLLESELFGHRRGAFTGAIRDKRGLFEQADGGSIFLDEIGDVSLSVQVKLLRALQNREIQPLGDTAARQVDTRVIAATHRDLETEVREGRFREDLFYRLNVITLRIPPLRQRKEDVPLLARHFFAAACAEAGRNDLTGLSSAVQEVFSRYPWPGNVRELENAIAGAVALSNGPEIGVADLPDRLSGGASIEEEGLRLPAGTTLEQAERLMILDALDRAGGSKREAAAALGISLATLYRKLAGYQAEEGKSG